MSNAKKDDNGYPSIFGMSCVDGITPIRIALNASNGGVKIDTMTTTSFTPFSVSKMDDNGYPMAKGVSSLNGSIILPWYVNPSTNALLIEQ